MRGGQTMPQLTIELEPEELRLLHTLAKRKRRSDAQQAAYSLVKYLTEAERTPAPALPSQERLSSVEAGGDGPRAGIDQVIVGAAGERE